MGKALFETAGATQGTRYADLLLVTGVAQHVRGKIDAALLCYADSRKAREATGSTQGVLYTVLLRNLMLAVCGQGDISAAMHHYMKPNAAFVAMDAAIGHDDISLPRLLGTPQVRGDALHRWRHDEGSLHQDAKDSSVRASIEERSSPGATADSIRLGALATAISVCLQCWEHLRSGVMPCICGAIMKDRCARAPRRD